RALTIHAVLYAELRSSMYRPAQLAHVSLEYFYWRNSETNEHFEGAVENLKDVIAAQATILALLALTGGQDDATISGSAIGTDDVGFPHRPNMKLDSVQAFQLKALTPP